MLKFVIPMYVYLMYEYISKFINKRVIKKKKRDQLYVNG